MGHRTLRRAPIHFRDATLSAAQLNGILVGVPLAALRTPAITPAFTAAAMRLLANCAAMAGADQVRELALELQRLAARDYNRAFYASFATFLGRLGDYLNQATDDGAVTPGFRRQKATAIAELAAARDAVGRYVPPIV